MADNLEVVFDHSQKPAASPGLNIVFGDVDTSPFLVVFNHSNTSLSSANLVVVFGETDSSPLIIVSDHKPPAGGNGSPITIVLGDGGDAGGGIAPAPVTVNIQLAVPGVSVRAGIRLPVVTNITLGLPVVKVLGVYTSGAQRPLIDKVDNSWQVATGQKNVLDNRWQNTNTMPFSRETHWQTGSQLGTQFSPVHQDAIHAGDLYSTKFQKANTLPERIVRTGHQVADDSVRLTITTKFQKAVQAVNGAQEKWNQGNPQSSAWENHFQKALPLRLVQQTGFQKALSYFTQDAIRHQVAMRPPPGTHEVPIVVIPPVTPCYTPPLGNAVHLLFSETEWDTHLVFSCENHGGTPPGETIVLPIRKVYMSFNDFILTVVATGEVVPCTDFSLTIDRGSWSYGFNATIPFAYLDDIQAGSVDGRPPEISVQINGNPYRLVAENMGLSRTHNKRAITLSGRGRNAFLDSPYVPDQTFTNTELRTSQQLMDDVLKENGVSIGWTVDWGLTAWAVPANAFSQRGSYIKGLQSIAAAAGGYLQPHPTDQIIRVLPGYPLNTPKWLWSDLTPDYELPSAAVTKLGVNWNDMPYYNRIYVSGTNQGIVGRVTVTGTDGTRIAPTVTDPLITHVDAARQRGITELTATGSQVMFQMELQILPEIGIIDPGKFILYTEGSSNRVGVVRGNNINVGQSTRQVLTVESYDD